MSDDRFRFLEIGEGSIGGAETAFSPAEPDLASAQGTEPRGPRDADGLPLAQVRAPDLRGYQAALRETDDAEAVNVPGARRSEFVQPQNRLRLAEVFGSRGSGMGQFQFPTGLAADSSGNLFVADSVNHRVQRITPGGGVSVLGGRGTGRGQFLSPQGVATDARSAFYIAEQGNHRVQKYSAAGVLELMFGRYGKGNGEFSAPTGIAVAPGTGDIYVADTGNSRVQRFDPAGGFLSVIGAPGGLYAPLVSPQSVAVDSRDHLWVADTLAHRIVEYDPLGRPVARLLPLPFQQPRAVACDMSGLLYVADFAPVDALSQRAHGRVLALDPHKGLTRAAVDGGNERAALSRPGGVAPSLPASQGGLTGRASSDLYVSDTLSHRILRFVWE